MEVKRLWHPSAACSKVLYLLTLCSKAQEIDIPSIFRLTLPFFKKKKERKEWKRDESYTYVKITSVIKIK